MTTSTTRERVESMLVGMDDATLKEEAQKANRAMNDSKLSQDCQNDALAALVMICCEATRRKEGL